MQGHGVGVVSHPYREWQRSSEAHSGWHFGADRAGAEWRDDRPESAQESPGHAVRFTGTLYSPSSRHNGRIPSTMLSLNEWMTAGFNHCFLRYTKIPSRKDFWLRATGYMLQRDSGWCRREMWVWPEFLELVCITHDSFTNILVSRCRSICITWLGVWKKRTIVFWATSTKAPSNDPLNWFHLLNLNWA